MALVRRYIETRSTLKAGTSKILNLEVRNIKHLIEWNTSDDNKTGTINFNGERLKVNFKVDKKPKLEKLELIWFVTGELYPVYLLPDKHVVVRTETRFKSEKEARRKCRKNLRKLGDRVSKKVKRHLRRNRLTVEAISPQSYKFRRYSSTRDGKTNKTISKLVIYNGTLREGKNIERRYVGTL